MNGENRYWLHNINFGNILTLLAMGGALVGVWSNLNAQVSNQAVEINNLKVNQMKYENQVEARQSEVRRDIRDVKKDVKDLDDKLTGKLDRVLDELRTARRESR